MHVVSGAGEMRWKVGIGNESIEDVLNVLHYRVASFSKAPLYGR